MMELYLILYVTIASGFVPVPLVAQPNITTTFGRVCANEQIIVYCIGEGRVEWTSDLAIGPGSITFRDVDIGMTVNRGNATAELVSVNVNTNTINSSLAYSVNDGVIIICTDDSGRSSSYAHPIYQRRFIIIIRSM